MSHTQRMDSLTGLRGLAALAVVVSHIDTHGFSPLVSYEGIGTAAVAIFFSLSGFLMGNIYINKDFNFSVANKYIISRVSRVAPAYLFIVSISFLIYSFIDPSYPFAIDINNILRHVLFSGNQGVLWSIPPEIQFYFLFPLIWYGCAQAREGNINLMYALTACYALIVYNSAHFPGTIVFSKLPYFILGVLAGTLRSKVILNKTLNLTTLIIQLAFFVGILIVLFEGAAYDNRDFWLNQSNAITAALLVFSFSLSTPLTKIILENKAALMLGEWSFSLYLTHVITLHYISPFLNSSLAHSVIAILLSILLSWIFYIGIEKRGIKIARAILERTFIAKRKNED